MEIRRATPDDAEALREIAISRIVSSREKDARSGLIDYPTPTLVKYLKRIERGDWYVACEDGAPVGFLDAYPRAIVPDIFPGDAVVDQILKMDQGPLRYMNTIAVRATHEGRGIGPKLLGHAVCDALPEESIWVAIVHAPLLNRTSSMLASHAGFSCIDECVAHDLVFGLYRLQPRT